MLQTSFPSETADHLLHTLQDTLHFCESVTRQEEATLLSRLEHKAAAIVAELQEEHEQEEELIARLRYLVKRWRQTGLQEDAQAILQGLSDFTAFKLLHLNREERELRPILWQHFSDEELKGMEQQSQQDLLQTA